MTEAEKIKLGEDVAELNQDRAWVVFMDGYAHGLSAREMATLLYSMGWSQGVVEALR